MLCAITLVVILLSACASRTPISATNFQRIMEENGFEVRDVTYQTESNEIELVLLGIMGGSYQFEFYEISSEYFARRFYNTMPPALEERKGTSYTSRTLGGRNFESYELTTSGMYFHLLRVENVVIFVEADAAFRDDIREIFGLLR